MSGGLLTLLGSSRGDGNTAKALRVGFGDHACLDLNTCCLSPYDYNGVYPDQDEFFEIAEKMIAASDILLATPVYWYAMSAQMKLFIDRWSDLITIRKDIGRSLAGRRLWMLATSDDPAFPPGFEIPFEFTARYMGMDYRGGVLVCCAGAVLEEAELMAFAARVQTEMRLSS